MTTSVVKSVITTNEINYTDIIIIIYIFGMPHSFYCHFIPVLYTYPGNVFITLLKLIFKYIKINIHAEHDQIRITNY